MRWNEIVTLYDVISSNIYDRHPATFELYVPLKWNVLGNLSVWPNQYTNCYFLKNNLGPERICGKNGIDITWNNGQTVKLVIQLMIGIR